MKTELKKISYLRQTICQLHFKQQLTTDEQLLIKQVLPRVNVQLMLALLTQQTLGLTLVEKHHYQAQLIQALAQNDVLKMQKLWQQLIPVRYQLQPVSELVAFFKALEEMGWDVFSLQIYARAYRDLKPISIRLKVQQAKQQSQKIGSKLYSELFSSYHDFDRSPLFNRQKIELVLNQLGAYIDDFGMLQLATNCQFDFDLEMSPDAPFLKAFAKAVQLAFWQRELDDKRIHQFRMYLDLHNLRYIRQHFGGKQVKDIDALRKFVLNQQINQPLYRLKRQPARYHNKYMKGRDFLAQRLNYKRLTPDFHSEFIFDDNGQFVSQWQVLKKADNGLVISDPNAYELNLMQKKQILNGESFNYANRNDQTHVNLDSLPPKKLDHQLRKLLFKDWSSPNRKVFPRFDVGMSQYSNWS